MADVAMANREERDKRRPSLCTEGGYEETLKIEKALGPAWRYGHLNHLTYLEITRPDGTVRSAQA